MRGPQIIFSPLVEPALCMCRIKLILFTINTKLCQHHLMSDEIQFLAELG